MIISELIAILQDLPQDSKVVVPHFYRLKTGGLRENIWDILSVAPCYNQDTNKLVNYTIMSSIMPIDVK